MSNEIFVLHNENATSVQMGGPTSNVRVFAFDDSGDLIVDGDRVVAGHHVVQRARLKVDTVKWVMSKLAPKKYGDRPQVEEESKTLTISWQAVETPPPVAPSPPKQIAYNPPEMPADLSPADWSILMSVLELLRRTIPSNSDTPPAEWCSRSSARRSWRISRTRIRQSGLSCRLVDIDPDQRACGAPGR
jgi:terminase small subunit-like protein